MRIKNISIEEIKFIAHRLARNTMGWDEPIPEFGTRFPNILESCIDTPFMQFDRKDLYRGLIGKSSALFYFMIKNHPFQNGNKRIAVMTLLYLFHKNEKWLKISNQDLYIFAKNILRTIRPRKINGKKKILLFIFCFNFIYRIYFFVDNKRFCFCIKLRLSHYTSWLNYYPPIYRAGILKICF